jgi:hypothetical protein
MADAVCGPSNALQQFKQTTQNDRTLQQDRLINRQNPVQGFRSANPNAGLLDPEFEAFQAGLPVSDLPHFQHGLPQFSQQQQHFQQAPQVPQWAADFSQSAPLAAMNAQRPAVNTANWAQGFQSYVAQNAPRAQNSSPSPLAFQQMARYGPSGFQSQFAHSNFAPVSVQGKGKEPVTEQFDEAAFQQAFDQARDDVMVEDAPAQSLTKGQMEPEDAMDMTDLGKAVDDVAAREQRKKLAEKEYYEAGQRLDFDAVLDDMHEYTSSRLPQAGVIEPLVQEHEPTQQGSQQDDDDLAATAKELLEKVDNNQTAKFQNSQFLTLMRKLRDREVKVRGDQMVEAVSLTHPNLDRTCTPDSTYGSGLSSPAAVHESVLPATQHNSTICRSSISDILEDHRYDHWESPYT